MTKRDRRRRVNRYLLILIVVLELLNSSALCMSIIQESWDHITARRELAILTSLGNFKGKAFTKATRKDVRKALEKIRDVVDETVWTTDEVKYRKGPGKSYDAAGTLNKYSGVHRTGITYNGWSRVDIDDAEYYIKSKYLTDKVPIITDGGRKGQYQLYALSQFSQYGWADSEIYPLIKLWNRESGWNPAAHNRRSGAHGIPQALPAGKMAAYGSDYYTNGNTQIRWGLHYIASRYGSPGNAWAHLRSRGWY